MLTVVAKWFVMPHLNIIGSILSIAKCLTKILSIQVGSWIIYYSSITIYTEHKTMTGQTIKVLNSF